jgi:hypothetical protein
MITITNNVKMLKENKKAFIDGNAIINEQINLIITDKIKKLKKINITHSAKVTISGDVKNFTFSIESEDNETIKLIEKELNS